MNKRTLLNIVLALSFSGFSPIPALAQVQPPAPSVQNQEVTIPQSSAITITFPIAVTLDVGQKKSLTTAAYLVKPLLDSSGNVVAEANSPINIQIQPTKGGAQIKAEALVVGGRVTPIEASGPKIDNATGRLAGNAGETSPARPDKQLARVPLAASTETHSSSRRDLYPACLWG